MEKMKKIPNSALPIGKQIKASLKSLGVERRKDVLESMSEEEFIDYRVDVYLKELGNALQAGYSESGAQEIAIKESIGDLIGVG